LILYELFVGKSAFPEDVSPVRIVKLHVDNFRPEIPNDVNDCIRDIIQLCWAKDPERRPSFDGVYQMLERASFVFFDDVSPLAVKGFISDVERNIR
jgi:hypothetical protein